MDTVLSAFETAVNSVSDWVTLAFDIPSARAVVFGVPIKGEMPFSLGLIILLIFCFLYHINLVICSNCCRPSSCGGSSLDCDSFSSVPKKLQATKKTIDKEGRWCAYWVSLIFIDQCISIKLYELHDFENNFCIFLLASSSFGGHGIRLLLNISLLHIRDHIGSNSCISGSE